MLRNVVRRGALVDAVGRRTQPFRRVHSEPLLLRTNAAPSTL